jgi:hypothetical protein
MGTWSTTRTANFNCKGSTRRRVARLVLRHNWHHWQRIVFKRAMYPAWRVAACDWASEARWIAAEAIFSRPSKGLGAGSCCGYTGLAVYAPSQSRQSLYTLRSGLCVLLSGCSKSEIFCPTIGIGYNGVVKRGLFKFIEQHNYKIRYSTSRAEPTRVRPLVRHLPSCAAAYSQIVFSVPICWPSKWRHVTRRGARRLMAA